MSSILSSRAVSPKPTTATKSRGKFERMSKVRARTIFLAGTRLLRMAIERERSIAKTVAERRGGLELFDLEVVGVQLDRRPGP